MLQGFLNESIIQKSERSSKDYGNYYLNFKLLFFQNDVNEKESRWGAKTIEGSGHQESVSLDQLRKEVIANDNFISVSFFLSR